MEGVPGPEPRYTPGVKVAVIGAGTAGCAAALFLARDGHQVTLFEKVAEPTAIGAGIVLQPSGMSALASLDLLAPIVARGAVLHELLAVNERMKPVVNLRYEHLARDLYGLGLHRGVLFRTLFDAVKREVYDVRCGVAVEELRGRVLAEHELVVVADGARSHLRDQSEIPRRVTKYPWGALWFVGLDHQRRFVDRLYQVVRGTHRLLGILPTGLGPSGDVPLVSLFWSIEVATQQKWRHQGLAQWKEEILGYVPESAPILDQIQHVDQVLFSEYHDVVMRSWHRDNVVFLGDAAHATSPQLGQGCNLALVDAEVLARSLREAGSVSAGLIRYAAARKAHLAYYQLATRWLTPLFQSNLGWLGPIRDLLMPIGCRIPWVRKQMALGMCGTSRGPFLRAMPLAARPLALCSPVPPR